RPGTVTDLARDRRVDLDLAAHAERRLGEADRQAQQGVLSALRPRPRAARPRLAEEGVHDVVEAEALAEAATHAAAGQRVAAAVVNRALLAVGQHLVGRGDLLEALGRIRRVVDVRVQLARQAAVRLLQLF